MGKHEAPPFKMVIERGRLVPATAYDAERLDTYRSGMEVSVRFTEDKDRVMVRKWWAILNRAVKECRTPWKTAAQASEAVKLAIGVVNYTKTVGGEFMAYPKSLTELDDPELTDAVEQMIDVIYNVTGVDPAEWRKGVDHIRETENLASGQEIQIDEPSEGDPRPASDAGSGGSASAAAPESVASAADQAGEPASEAPDDPAAAGSPVALSADDRERLRKFAARVVNVIGGEREFLQQEAKRVLVEEGVPAGLATDKARSITKYASQACDDFTGKDALERSDAIEMIAGIVGCESKELVL